jgi:hypothetical protein
VMTQAAEEEAYRIDIPAADVPLPVAQAD